MEIEGDDRHHCNICNRCLDENELEIVDSLVELESRISSKNMLALVYIAGLVQMNAGSKIVYNPSFFLEKHGDFLRILSRGGLPPHPSNHTV